MAGDAGVTGVLLMAYGTPASPDQIEAYYTHIRRGRPPTPEQLDDLRRRYAAIGGISPLRERTRSQVAGIQAALGPAYVTALGQKHAAPFIEDAVAQLAGQGAERIVGLVLAPHYSALSVGEYHERASKAAGSVPYTGVPSWHLEPGLVSLLAGRVATALEPMPGAQVLFTAHSLPERVRAMGDPYPGQVAATGQAVADALGLPPERWRVAWQSAGRTPEPWLGPSLVEVIPDLAAGDVLVCPVGFTSDHLEVLYDIDIEARAAAEAAGKRLGRTASLNDDPAFCSVVAGVVQQAAATT
ncbi:MAG TPA: ferrochelatase [Acidimicrobiales bacterium]|nr:ferrochelatase [Acidimicrobiales bacterium]